MEKFPILKTQAELDIWLKQQKKPISFIPTMGSLHNGHKQLIKNAKAKNHQNESVVLVSIFINPLQFGANEDFKAYPRDLEKDTKTALNAGANAIWAPKITDIFPGGTEAHFKLEAPQKLKSQLCGSIRKGHFDGVVTVVIRLLSLIKPQVLVLGEKDWQQLIILRKLITDLRLPIIIQNVPTFRDEDGLASSSRNNFLNNIERKKALNLPMELEKARILFSKNNELDLNKIKIFLENKGLIVEYLETVDPEFLSPTKDNVKSCLLAAAIRIGKTRLIDHTFLMTRLPIVAIDGPAGAGKSTVTKSFAKKLGLVYLDTGAMYRAVTWLIHTRGIDPNNKQKVAENLKELNLQLELCKTGEQEVFVNGQNVSKAIRSPEITAKVSLIASQSSVREIMMAQQKEIGLKGGLVAEGRDIGTAVFPDAELKVFLTASAKERAKRRAIDLKNQGFFVPDLIQLEDEIKERDRMDSTREISPLRKANDAKELITDGMNIEEVVQSLINMFRLKVAEEIWPTP